MTGQRALTDEVIVTMADWVRVTTLVAGGHLSTAYLCAGYFAQGLEEELRRRRAAQTEAVPSPAPVEIPQAPTMAPLIEPTQEKE